MRDTIDMAETISHGWWLDDEKLKAFEALVRADEREQARSAPVKPVAFEVGLVEWVGNKLMATPKVTTTPPAQPAPVQPVAWVLLREDEDGFEPIQFYGGKEKPETAAGELKPRFTLRPVCFADTTPPAAQRQWVGLTDEERTEIRREHYARTLPLMDAVEAKLKEKNNG